MYILHTALGGAPCVWCYASAGLSFSLALLLATTLDRRHMMEAAGPGLTATAAAALTLYLGFGQVPNSTAAADFELPYTAPLVTTDSSDKAVGLARKLREAGAKMYGAFWCTHCFDQKQTFGKQAMEDFPYVECYPEGWKRVSAFDYTWAEPGTCPGVHTDGCAGIVGTQCQDRSVYRWVCCGCWYPVSAEQCGHWWVLQVQVGHEGSGRGASLVPWVWGNSLLLSQ
jgi:hypothetical protein